MLFCNFSLDCAICKQVSQSPALYVLCVKGHMICSYCYENDLFNQNCPVCKEPMPYKIRNRAVEDYVNETQVCCPNNGCNDTMLYKDIGNHCSSNCQYQKVVCPYKDLGCKWNGERRFRETHEHNLSLDTIVDKIKTLRQTIQEQLFTIRQDNHYIQDLIADNHDLELTRERLTEETMDIKKFIFEANISDTIELNSIWRDWNMANVDNKDNVNRITLRWTGDIKKGIQLTSYFKLLKKDCLVQIQIRFECRFINKIQFERQMDIMVGYSNTHNISNVDSTGIVHITKQITDTYESKWMTLIIFEDNDINNIHQLIQNSNAGIIKLFAKL